MEQQINKAPSNKVGQIFKENAFQFSLRRVLFDKLNIKTNTNYRGKTQDEVFYQKANGKEVEFEVVRRMDFDPEGVFEITVVFTVKRLLKDDINAEDIDFVDWTRNLTPQENTVLCGNVFTNMSLLIAEITSIGNNMPIISPPVFNANQN